MDRINIISCFAFFALPACWAVDPSNSDISAFIVNGRTAADATHPWQLSFQRRENGLWFHTCGATLIHEQFAVTASHCVYNRYKKNDEGKYDSYRISDMRVVAGANSLLPLDDDAEIYRIQGAITPFGLSAFFDVALLKLAVPANTSRDDIRAIQIANTTDVTTGLLCSVTGWGTVNSAKPKFTPVLREAAMRLVAYKDCKETGWQVAPFQTCARGVRRSATACFGDSGGPLSCQRLDGTPILVGVSSFVYKRCAVTRPNVFVNLPVYRNWIRRLTLIDDL